MRLIGETLLRWRVSCTERSSLNAKQTKPICIGLVCFVIKSERRKILKKWDLSVKMKIRKGEICRRDVLTDGAAGIAQHGTAGGFSGTDACGRVLDDQTIAGGKPQKLRCPQIRFRIGLAPSDHVATDHHIEL